ncbi:MAG: NAD(P)-dependent oxidoreductase [Deltaproteobacteria bacterium CG_4_10_14_0_2_um_filter_43_8]|nr:MAG: NADH(P)-binding protein [Deltaproteobacteria bacterium CG11_big_fil_rev_8_21_14_0_20_42_23]PJA21971.1 MAG: NAD(P)-dependent oxidoreductase [Deltaproteobacteria bacterium CG_4_10_14_0_2_um_filter_43_8]PJC64584.1 MAG: NAD(P)-dependent oxidoreductase [Deltaproteobacteria bacterium CG_4_9_14_0_2_um_filter_42_21]
MGHDLENVLVTGASGYLGSHVLEKLRKHGVPYIPTSFSGKFGKACDLTDRRAVCRLMDQIKPSIIIHCAAKVPKFPSHYNDEQTAEASISMVKNIAEYARCRIILASSMTVYDAVTNFPVREEDACLPHSGYAKGKWFAEQILLNRRFPGDVVLRLPGLFGLPRRSGLLYNATRSFVTHETFELLTPTELWAAMAVEDAAEYFLRATLTNTNSSSAQVINVGYNSEFDIFSAVKQIAAYCDIDWKPPLIKVKNFSMCLKRLKACYGLIDISFQQRLLEFVGVVRREFGFQSSGGSGER